MKKYVAIALATTALLLGLILLSPGYNSRVRDVEKRFSYRKITDGDTYVTDCTTEADSNINFPLRKASYAKVHFKPFWKFSKRLTSEQTIRIIALLNDTSTYEWGETGTAPFDRYVTFHDRDGNCIGVTQVCSNDKQTYSTPHIAKMKWGHLSDRAHKELIAMIE